MMELTVWVDGIPRVVSGASLDTTCQDVVIALAHALDRTGRFSLIEKWRNNSRPLTPEDCPLQVLHKWGEYAPEVQFILCQALTDDSKQPNKDKLMRKKGEQLVFSHHVMQPPGLKTTGNVSVKRSLTFSGGHNHPPQTSVVTSSAPVNKFRKTQKGSVPNGDVQALSGSACASRPSPQPLPKQQSKVGHHEQTPQSRTVQHPPHPIPSPRHRTSVQPQQDPDMKDSVQSDTPAPASSVSISDSHKSMVSSHKPLPAARSHPVTPGSAPASHTQFPAPGVSSKPKSESWTSPRPPQHQSQSQTVKPKQELQSVVHLQNQRTSPKPDSPPPFHLQNQRTSPKPDSPPPFHLQNQRTSPKPDSPPPFHLQNQRTSPKPDSPPPFHLKNQRTSPKPDSPPPPLPSSPPPLPVVLRTRPDQRHGPAAPEEEVLELEEVSMISPDHSRRASLEIEEYDLEHNFPDTHREYSHVERPSVSLEYCLEDGTVSGAGAESQQQEEEHAKLVKLVGTLEQQLKTQESQIGLINTEITTLEEKEKEYEEKLQDIMEELLLHENHQRDLELQLNDLEKVEWSNVLDGEKKSEIDLTLQIASMKTSILDHQEKLSEARTKEDQLLSELKEEEEKLSQEKERLKAEEAKVREEEGKTKEEISKLQATLSEEQKKTADFEASLSTIEGDLETVEKDLKTKEEEATDGEAKLKDENFKDFVAHPVPKEEPKPTDTGETVLKILEGRLSPRPPASPTKTGDNPHPPAFISTLTANSQSGVWV